MKQLRVLLLSLLGAGTHFVHLGGERQCGVKFLVQENNTMAGNRPRTTDIQRANHYTTAPPQELKRPL